MPTQTSTPLPSHLDPVALSSLRTENVSTGGLPYCGVGAPLLISLKGCHPRWPVLNKTEAAENP